MKKLVLTSVCTLAVAGAALAQGTVNWGGPSAASYTTQTNAVQLSPLFGGGASGIAGATVGNTANAATGFYFELLYTAYTGSQAAQPQTLAALATWTDAGLGGTNGTGSTGRNAVYANQANTAAVVPWANGTTDSVMLVEWSANLGTTFAAALASMQTQSYIGSGVNAFFGESQTGYINPNSGNPGAVIFGNATTAQGLPIGNSLNTPLYVLPVPEPGTIAMAALGGLSLLAFRRKK